MNCIVTGCSHWLSYWYEHTTHHYYKFTVPHHVLLRLADKEVFIFNYFFWLQIIRNFSTIFFFLFRFKTHWGYFVFVFFLSCCIFYKQGAMVETWAGWSFPFTDEFLVVLHPCNTLKNVKVECDWMEDSFGKC